MAVAARSCIKNVSKYFITIERRSDYFAMETELTTSWITNLSEAITNRSPLPPALSIVGTIGMIPVVLIIIFVLLIVDTVPTDFLIFQALATSVVVFGPLFIWRYETEVYPTFVDLAKDVTPYDDNRELLDIAETYKQFFSRKFIYISTVWIVIICGGLIVNIGYFESLGVDGYADPAFAVYLIFALWWSIVTGIGLHGALTTVLCIREIGTLNFTIDPLHPDGLGGLSTVGYFAIRSTTLVSIGALTLPLAFAIAAEGGFTVLVYTAVTIYIGTIVFSFVYPTVYIHIRAKEIRNEILEDKRRQIHSFHTEILDADEGTDLDVLQVQLETMRKEYEQYDQVNLYPMSISIFSRLLSSIMLPLFFVVVETYVLT